MRVYLSRLGIAFRIADTLLIVCSLVFASWLHDYPWDPHFSFLALCAAILFHFLARHSGLYLSWRVTSGLEESKSVIAVWSCVVLVILLIGFITTLTGEYSRRVFITWFASSQLALIFWRLAIRAFLRTVRRKGKNGKSVAIAGAGALGVKVAGVIRNAPWMGFEIYGFYDDFAEKHSRPVTGSDAEVKGDLDRMVEDAATDGRINIVYMTLPMRAEERLKEIVDKLSDTSTSVHLVPDFFTLDLLNARMVDMDGIPTISVYESPFHGPGGWLKRVEDMLLSGLILLGALPLMTAIALGVKLSSPGPVFFTQRRYGVDGKEIGVLKFRTMTVCEDGAVIPQARKNDRRVTGFGAFLRKTSLDELPQFINVLQGTMSIVGPRPHAVAHNEYYRRIIPRYMLRHKVKPGITGWAQVNGWRGETDTVEKMARRVQFDLDYMRCWSFWLDVKIICKTVAKGFTDKSAY